METFSTVVAAVCTGAARTIRADDAPARHKTYQTAILKTPRQGRVAVGPLGLEGDVQSDRRNHGGLDQAVHAHFRGTARALAGALGRIPAYGELGENLTLAEGSEAEVCVGDVFRVGSTVLQATCPRIPCATIGDQLQWPDAVAWVVREGCTGFYFRVLEPGGVGAGDVLTLLERPNPSLTMAWLNGLNRAKQADPEDVRLLLSADGLAARWRARFARRWISQQLSAAHADAESGAARPIHAPTQTEPESAAVRAARR